jgi:hypothetical protein
MNIYVPVKEYPDGRKQYRLLQASDDELPCVQADWTRLVKVDSVRSGIAEIANADV